MIQTSNFKKWLGFGVDKIEGKKRPYFQRNSEEVIGIFLEVFKDIYENNVSTRKPSNVKGREQYFEKILDMTNLLPSNAEKHYFYNTFNTKANVKEKSPTEVSVNLDENKSQPQQPDLPLRSLNPVQNDPKSDLKSHYDKKSSKSQRPESTKYLPNDDIIKQKLKTLDNQKLSSIYYSLTKISLKRHTPILTIGLWAFLETLTAASGREENTAFDHFFSDNRLREWGIERTGSKNIRDTLNRINKEGNVTKHSANKAYFNSEQLVNDLIVIKPVILKCIDAAITRRKTSPGQS